MPAKSSIGLWSVTSTLSIEHRANGKVVIKSMNRDGGRIIITSVQAIKLARLLLESDAETRRDIFDPINWD